jgi:hypothetical protein
VVGSVVWYIGRSVELIIATSFRATWICILLGLVVACDSKQEVRPNPKGKLPFGYVETVRPGATITGEVAVKGWALSEDGIERVCVYLDRSQVGCTEEVTETRPDVAKVFSPIKDADKSGWSITFDSARLQPGEHEFVVQAVGKNGISRDLIETKVVIAR